MQLRGLLVGVMLLGLTPAASAAPGWMQPGKAGPFMLNLQIGPAIGAKDAINMGAVVLDLGIAVDRNRNAYLLLPLQFQFANVSYSIFGAGTSYTVGFIMVPLGFQYDIAIPQVPGLYISPRLVGGYLASTASCNNCNVNHGGFIAPEVTLKLVISKRWNVGLVPFSLPIIMGDNGAGGINTSIDYRILFLGGVNL